MFRLPFLLRLSSLLVDCPAPRARPSYPPAMLSVVRRVVSPASSAVVRQSCRGVSTPARRPTAPAPTIDMKKWVTVMGCVFVALSVNYVVLAPKPKLELLDVVDLYEEKIEARTQAEWEKRQQEKENQQEKQ